MLVPHDSERVRSYQLSGSAARVVTSITLIAALLLTTFTVGFFVRQADHLEARRLERVNVLLAAEVDQIRGEIHTLAAALDSLSDRDADFRAIAGLPAIDGDVRRVGIGGPGTPTLERSEVYHLDQEMGGRVFAASYDVDALSRRAGLLRSSMDEALVTLERNRERLEATPSIAPADGTLSSLFSPNRRHPVLRISRPHKGIDIAASVGEPILAPASGVVRRAGHRTGGYGNTVEIDHGYGYVTRFAHTSRIHVRSGERVERGQMIAEVGATGLVSGPHLHYEVEVNGKQVDPLNFILADAIPD